jgi:hypothetical protein
MKRRSLTAATAGLEVAALARPQTGTAGWAPDRPVRLVVPLHPRRQHGRHRPAVPARRRSRRATTNGKGPRGQLTFGP